MHFLSPRRSRTRVAAWRCFALVVVGALFAPSVVEAQQGFGGQRSFQRATGTQNAAQFGQMNQLSQLGTGQTGGVGSQPQGMGQGMNPTQQGRLQNGSQQGFVGRDAQDIRNNYTNLSRSDRRRVMFDMIVENLNEMRRDRERSGRRRSPPPPARVQITPDIEVNAPPPDVAANTAATRAGAALARRQIRGVAMNFEDGVIVLRGEVASDYERALAEQLIALEPGVGEVNNQLAVVVANE